MASRNDQSGFENASRDRPQRDRTFEAQQGSNITTGRRMDRARGGASNRVSPSGGEYLSGAPREYPSEAYSDQGFGKKSRARPNWRTEDKIFGPDGLVDEEATREDHRGRGPRGYRRPDTRIREDACEALTDDSYLDATNIDVSVQDGEVTLAGTVTSRADKRRAEDIVERVRGVRDVHNQVRVISVP